MRINSNITALKASNSLLFNEGLFSASTQRLSSGYKINKAADNPTGYAISARMRKQIDALNRCDQSATTASSVLDTVDGALDGMTEIIQRLNELAVKSANGTLSSSDRYTIQEEVEQLTGELERVSESTTLNEQVLLNGQFRRTGYTENDNIHVQYYSDAVDAGSRSMTVEESYSGGKLTVTVQGAPGRESGSAGELAMTFDYPMYVDTGKKYENGSEYLGVTSGLYEDGSGKGSLKIDKDGNQYLTVNGDHGESLTLKIDSAAFTVTAQTGTTESGDTYEFDSYTLGSTTFNMDLTGGGTMTVQVGTTEEETLEMTFPQMSLALMDLDDLDLSTMEGARHGIDKVSHALKYVTRVRSAVGAYQNRMDHTISFIAQSTENMESSLSRIMDTDMASEMTKYANYQVLTQAGTSILAQANQTPQQALQLLQ